MWCENVKDYRRLTLFSVFVLSMSALGSGCSDDPDESEDNNPDPIVVIDDPTDERNPGVTDFTSADGSAGESSPNEAGGTADGDTATEPSADSLGAEGGGGESRSVEEGDIYRLVNSNLLINLNAYRGVQLIDISDVDAPQIVGGVRISGYPVELYVDGNMVYVLMNDWQGYYGSRHAPEVTQRQGGVVVAVDISDRTTPQIVDQAFVPGNIQTSRLSRGGGATALYVVASGWNVVETSTGGPGEPVSSSSSSGGAVTVVKSFDVSDGQLVAQSELDLGGYVSDIQATPEALLVARNSWYGNEWEEEGYSSRVSLVDISDPNGIMVEGDQALVLGQVETQFNMDIQGNVLRVVSGSRWGSNRTNYIQTFDVTDINAITEIARDDFGDNEDLYATLFVGNKAFFVTYFRTDPFHAFFIGDDGSIEEMSEYIVSGWNDFFRPVFDATRLVGIGTNDEDGRTMAVSLYDITDLTNPTPLISRAEVAAENSWSEASWDHRAFSVIEGLSGVASADGTEETGMVLLPYQGWSDDGYNAAVQIFTFSENTLTQRGVMDHGTNVRRSFGVDEGITGNLSDVDLTLFDTENPDSPSALGTVELAPNFTDIIHSGDYNIRVKSSMQPGYWYYNDGQQPNVVAEVVSADHDADNAAALASVELTAGSTVVKVQDLLVGAVTSYQGYDETDGQQWLTTFQIFDFSNPLAPTLVSTFETDVLAPNYGGYYGEDGDIAMDDCFDCGGYYYGPSLDSRNFAVVDGGIAFLKREWHNEILGHEEICQTYPTHWNDCYDGETSTPDSEPSSGENAGSSGGSGGSADAPEVDVETENDDEPTDEDAPEPEREEPTEDVDDVDEGDDGGFNDEDCGYYEGNITCRSLDGAEPVCEGEISYCATDAETGDWTCDPIDPDDISTETYCWDYDLYRYWEKFALIPLDLSTPSTPALGSRVALAEDDEGVSMLGDGNTVWLSYKRPTEVTDSSNAFVRFYIQEVGLTTPAAPELGVAVNVPGELIAKSGETLFTRDYVYGDAIIETAIAKLRLDGELAYLEAFASFANQQVSTIELDGAGKLLVSHRESWQTFEGDWHENVQQLTILDAEAELEVLGVAEVDTWANLQDARDGRALFTVPGGILVFNIEDATSPYPQAYFSTQGWPQSFTTAEDQVMFAAGPYGIYTFDLNTFNLWSDID